MVVGSCWSVSGCSGYSSVGRIGGGGGVFVQLSEVAEKCLEK